MPKSQIGSISLYRVGKKTVTYKKPLILKCKSTQEVINKSPSSEEKLKAEFENTLLITMVNTFYLHLEFNSKNGNWSLNLPFLCAKCGVCCTLEDFLTAGPTKPEPQIDTRVRALFKELGKRWEEDQAEYDRHVAQTPCPFLAGNECSIYEFRPNGCRLFPNTTFGMLTKDCPALNRFKKQRSLLKKGKSAKMSYHSVSEDDDSVMPVCVTDKRYAACVAKLRRTGATEEELALFHRFNRKPLA